MWRLCRTQQNKNNFLGTAPAVLFFRLSEPPTNVIMFRKAMSGAQPGERELCRAWHCKV